MQAASNSNSPFLFLLSLCLLQLSAARLLPAVFFSPSSSSYLPSAYRSLLSVDYSQSCDVRLYGAACDGQTDDTVALQKALDSCPLLGLQLIVPAGGVCLSQPLFISRNQTRIWLDKGAVLRAGRKWFGGGPPSIPGGPAFLSAFDKTDLQLAGPGMVDGSGAQWWTGNNTTPGRPFLVNLVNCHRVAIGGGLQLVNAAMWSLFVSGDTVFISHIAIRSPTYSVAPNTDGIDVAASNVLIEYADVRNGDDSICMKSGARNVLVRDSVVRQGNGLVVGTGGGIRDIVFEWCLAENTLFGVHIKAKDDQSGAITNITFSNIRIVNPGAYAMGVDQMGQGTIWARRDPFSSFSSSSPSSFSTLSSSSFLSSLSAVKISHVLFRNITGAANVAGRFVCSPQRELQCTDIRMEGVDIRETVEGCSFTHVFGSADDHVNPPSCRPPLALSN